MKTLKKEDIKKALRLYLRGKISRQELAKWAGNILVSDDIIYDDKDKEIISEIIMVLDNFDNPLNGFFISDAGIKIISKGLLSLIVQKTFLVL